MTMEIRQLISQCENELDELINQLLQEEREIAENKDELDHLNDEIESLKSRKACLTGKISSLTGEEHELSHRLKVVQAELRNVESANEEQKETLKCLVMEVAEKEQEKENRVDKMVRDFNNTLKLWKCYKGYLDMRITLTKPDLYHISFSAAKNSPTSLTLRSLPDLKDWEVMEVNGKPALEDELTAYLAETNDILGVMCEARRRCRK